MKCSCEELKINGKGTGSRNWNPDCKEHGLGTEYYGSDEQVYRRGIQSFKLRATQAEARRCREGGDSNPDFFKELDKEIERRYGRA